MHGLHERDFDVPEPLLGEARAGCKGFRTLPLGLEWLALHTDHRHQSVDPGMTQCLMHSPFRDRVLAQTFSTVFCLFAYPMGINAPAHGAFDPVKEGALDAIKTLQSEGVRVVMLTGDNRVTTEAVARRLNIEEVKAGVLPGNKCAAVEDLRAHGRFVAMAGDGVNDAPELAAADVGIATGTGTDVAIESAGVTLLKGDLKGILRARRLSEKPMRNIRQNLFFAFVYTLSREGQMGE
jgi:soluble P-type ATPase